MKILIVDDSAVYRTMLKHVVSEYKEIEVKSASSAKGALAVLKEGDIDIVILDLEMPEMTGIEMLDEMKKQKLDEKSKVIMFSATSTSAAEMTVKALSAGAVDFVRKPDSAKQSREEVIEGIKSELIVKILNLSNLSSTKSNSRFASDSNSSSQNSQTVPTIKNFIDAAYSKAPITDFQPKIITIASSTGGPPALENIFNGIGNENSVPILIAQHMPPVFTKAFAKNLDRISSFTVKEAENREILKPGHVYIAPGDYHMEVSKPIAGNPFIRLHQGEKVHSVRPAADPLFFSISKIYGASVLGFVLTGMGSDGALGAKSLVENGGQVFIQDERTAVVWGMPGATYELGGFNQIGDLSVAKRLLKKFSEK